ncbi:MAG: hypothetical protein DRJ01_12530 [Bacteroidetes bacterium]|nr:MAG: hypothetical protein DRJ01_12530 [Bacteroidota bacterium]
MSINDVYEYKQGEYQDLTKIEQAAAGTNDTTFKYRGMQIAGYNINLFDDVIGTTQLILDTDYTLLYRDVKTSANESEDVFAGYNVINVAYQSVSLFLDIRCIGGYTKFTGGQYEEISTPQTITPLSFGYTVYCDTSGGDITLTINDPDLNNDTLTVVSDGANKTTLTMTGIAGQEVPGGEARTFLWVGTAWFLVSDGTDGVSIVWQGSLTTAPSSPELNWGYYDNILLKSFIWDGDSWEIIAVDGIGVPAGGDTAQVLQKDSASDNDTSWKTLPLSAFETTPYGEALVSGELFLDGTNSFTSSKNRIPVIDVVDYIPAIKTIDGIDYEPTELKWPGERGTYPFFREYTNVIQTSTETIESDATLTNEGDWKKIEATATSSGTLASVRKTSDPTVNDGFLHILLKNGIGDKTQITFFGGTTGAMRVDWDTKAFTSIDGGQDVSLCYFISDEIASINLIGVDTAKTSVRIYAELNTGYTDGDSSYYKELMLVDLDYPVPYTKGTHQANKLQYVLDYSTSTSWTIEGWFFANNQSLTQYLLDPAPPGKLNDIALFYYGGDFTLSTGDGSAASTLILTGIVDQEYNYFKIIITSGTSVDIYINDETVQSKTTNPPDVNLMSKVFTIGCDYAFNNPLLGYVQDLRFYAGSDTSTTHYTSGLPYYNPNKTMGKNALWSIYKGHFSGIFDNAGRIIFSDILDGQYITKWDTGLMMIAINPTTTTDYDNAKGDFFRNSSVDLQFYFVETFTELFFVTSSSDDADVASSLPFTVELDNVRLLVSMYSSFTAKEVTHYILAIGLYE